MKYIFDNDLASWSYLNLIDIENEEDEDDESSSSIPEWYSHNFSDIKNKEN